jgi:hypothetical protein
MPCGTMTFPPGTIFARDGTYRSFASHVNARWIDGVMAHGGVCGPDVPLNVPIDMQR